MEPGEKPSRASAICSSVVSLMARAVGGRSATSVSARSCGQYKITVAMVQRTAMVRVSQCFVQLIVAFLVRRLRGLEARLVVRFFAKVWVF